MGSRWEIGEIEVHQGALRFTSLVTRQTSSTQTLTGRTTPFVDHVSLSDFRTQFYAPTKHFAGQFYDTLYFNVIIIWMMSFLLLITLYFDVFKRLISGKDSF